MTAADAFTAKVAEFEALVQRVKLMSDSRLGVDPAKADWGDVGDLGSYVQALREITDRHFKEGEFAQ